MSPEKQQIFLSLNHTVSILTIILGIFLLFWIIGLVYCSKRNGECKTFSFFYKFALPIGFFTSLVSAFITLFYSDYLGVLPCGLCWFQRVALYAMVIVFGVAWFKKDRNIFPYVLALAIFGEIVSIYHHYLQLGYSEFIPCPVVASFADCAKPTFVEFGFITFPFMSVVLFAFFILLASFAHKCDKKS